METNFFKKQIIITLRVLIINYTNTVYFLRCTNAVYFLKMIDCVKSSAFETLFHLARTQL